MGDLLSIDKFALFIAFFIPGFVIVKVHGVFVPSEERDWTKDFPNAFAYSVFHYALTIWPLFLLHESAFIAYAYVDVLILPVAWPTVFALIRKTNGDLGMLFDARCRKLIAELYRDILTRKATPTPWDEMFQEPAAYWVRIRTKSNRWVGGRMTKGSATSIFPREREIYIRTAWDFDENGDFDREKPTTAGVWIAGSEIETIELQRGQDEENHDVT